MPRQLTDKAIIVTGASSGIGAATALACAEAGMHVLLNARRGERLEQVAADIRALGRDAAIVVGDVAEPETTDRILQETNRVFGGFYAVFANAGYGMEKPVLGTSVEDLRRIFDVNFFASVHLVQESAHALVRRKQGGHMLMCSSCLAKFTIPYYGAYSATKAAQNHICRAMRAELRPHGIEVASVHPVTTAAEFFEVAQDVSGGDAGGQSVPDHAPSLFVQSPQRVARAVVRCLRRPRSEVWTSTIVRGTAAAMTFAPGLLDVVMGRMTDGRPAGRPEPEGANVPDGEAEGDGQAAAQPG
jgi:short-subunit dehydrogenase